MALNRDKFRKIVGGITTAEPPEPPSADIEQAGTAAQTDTMPLPAGQGSGPARASAADDEADTGEQRRFAMRGRPKGRKEETSRQRPARSRYRCFSTKPS